MGSESETHRNGEKEEVERLELEEAVKVEVETAEVQDKAVVETEVFEVDARDEGKGERGAMGQVKGDDAVTPTHGVAVDETRTQVAEKLGEGDVAAVATREQTDQSCAPVKGEGDEGR